MMSSSLTGRKLKGMRTYYMRKLKMPKQELNNFEYVFHIFEASQNAKGVSETTLNHYKYNLKNISKYLDVKKPFDDVTKSDVELMVAAMRKAGLAHNSMINWNLAFSWLPLWGSCHGFSRDREGPLRPAGTSPRGRGKRTSPALQIPICQFADSNRYAHIRIHIRGAVPRRPPGRRRRWRRSGKGAATDCRCPR